MLAPPVDGFTTEELSILLEATQHKAISQFGSCGMVTATPTYFQSESMASSASGDHRGIGPRVGAMLVIFVVSLFASSFPSISNRVSFLRIPRIIFFIGKHFGTGVILSTAFVHLLQDSFEALTDPAVLARWNLGKYVGHIVLGSIISIFLVEYISTSYVDRLQSKDSPISSPPDTPPRTTLHLSLPQNQQDDVSRPPPFTISHDQNASFLTHGIDGKLQSNDSQASQLSPSPHPSGHTHSFSYGATTDGNRTPNPDQPSDSYFFRSHHRHESRNYHPSHHTRGSRISVIYDEEQGNGQDAVVEEHRDSNRISGDERDPAHRSGAEISHDDGGAESGLGHSHGHGHGHDHDHHVHVGKKRQIVGILVLQAGIMIHSIVIGVTLAITSGTDFASLLTAIIFHQLFEGLSLGIRIASLPTDTSSSKQSRGEPSRRRGGYAAIMMTFLKPTLAFLFAITNPLGIIIGLLVLRYGGDELCTQVIQGVMSAISAGMLIYAACVEMLAGDFVMDPLLWRSGVGKQVLAVGSLLVGVATMSAIG